MSKHKYDKQSTSRIKNGSWGIFQELDPVPQERWDPFRTVSYKDGEKIGHQSYISTIRADRPHENVIYRRENSINHIQEGGDTFCQLIKGKLPSIVLSRDLSLTKDPLSVESDFEDLTETEVFTSVNLFTPMTRIVQTTQDKSLKIDKVVKGIPLLHVFTNHYNALEEIPEHILVLYLKNIILTVNASLKSLSTNKKDLFPLLHFYNIGSHAGASIPHLHSQTYLYSNKKGHGWKNHGFLVASKNHKQITGNNSFCLGCSYSEKVERDPFNQILHIKERIIWEDEYWMVLTAYAPERDAQIRLLPKRHVSSLWEIIPVEISSLAHALIIANKALSNFVKDFGERFYLFPDRNILFRQQQSGNHSSIHMIIDIIPAQRIGGAEILDDYRISHIYPEKAAKYMKQSLFNNKMEE
ncbi:MAG: hypothetical protein ACXAC8_05680 [Candidatus Hodarchaeales archaeon]|jgi:galactose-1-phosphate uridylyltransferase